MPKDIKSFNKQKGGKNNGRKEQSTYNEQETYRMQKGENTSRKSQNAGSNGMVQNTQSKGLSNYQKQQQEKLGKDFKATNVETARQSKNELIVSHGFKGATGIDMGVFETNKSTTESAFYSDNNIYVKHDSMASKKSTNFKPYHEFGHWLKDNKNSQWKKLYDIIDNSITKKQMEDYKNVLNDKSIFDNMTEEQQKDYIINEIISDYVGNWANDIINWKDYLSVISEEYQQFISDIALENEFVGYNVFGTLEQQEQMFNKISNIMKDIIGKDNFTIKSNNQEVRLSDRELQEYSETAKKI